MSKFKNIDKIYTAIKDIDKALKSTSTDKLDDVMNYINDIERKNFDVEILNEVIGSIRKILVKLYLEELSVYNKDIGLTPEDFNIKVPVVEEKAATNIFDIKIPGLNKDDALLSSTEETVDAEYLDEEDESVAATEEVIEDAEVFVEDVDSVEEVVEEVREVVEQQHNDFTNNDSAVNGVSVEKKLAEPIVATPVKKINRGVVQTPKVDFINSTGGTAKGVTARM